MDSYRVDGGGGVELRVDTIGPTDAVPIVFIHGFSQSRLCWKPQCRSRLSADFRLVRFDLRGHGDSDKPTDAYSDSNLWAADVEAVIDSLNADGVVLVGWSYGGLVMSDYLSVHGTDEVFGLNYVSAISEKGTDDAASFAGEQFVDLFEGFQTTDVEWSVETLASFVDLCVASPLGPEDHHLMLGYNLRTPPRVREALQARSVENESTLRELDVPVLLTHGDEDPVVGPGAARKHADLIPNTDLSIFEGCGHSPFWEDPDRFNSELREFTIRLGG